MKFVGETSVGETSVDKKVGTLHEEAETKHITALFGKHIHDPDPSHIQGAAVITRAKKRALETLEPTSTVISESVQGLARCSYLSRPNR
ncbi:hypothetical protein V9T40_009355 [Parthenolecanium corni]|uniref:Uncharacterized protein n=1 Tax=Parthenolecanium corni TaxID=536013 RepID=A0AAN9TMJ5_9HEMI